MEANPETLRCSNDECQVCNLNSKLIQHGAEAISLSDLEENACRLHVHNANADHCLHALRLDLDNAGYRNVSKGRVTRMCDFAILAVTGTLAQLIVVELKSGEASPNDIEQLSQGLRVLHTYFEENGLKPQPIAYFVAGRNVDKLSFALRDRLTSLNFGSTIAKLRILKCGDSLSLEPERTS